MFQCCWPVGSEAVGLISGYIFDRTAWRVDPRFKVGNLTLAPWGLSSRDQQGLKPTHFKCKAVCFDIDWTSIAWKRRAPAAFTTQTFNWKHTRIFKIYCREHWSSGQRYLDAAFLNHETCHPLLRLLTSGVDYIIGNRINAQNWLYSSLYQQKGSPSSHDVPNKRIFLFTSFFLTSGFCQFQAWYWKIPGYSSISSCHSIAIPSKCQHPQVLTQVLGGWEKEALGPMPKTLIMVNSLTCLTGTKAEIHSGFEARIVI